MLSISPEHEFIELFFNGWSDNSSLIYLFLDKP